ncbi:MAG: exodeoxyribonuclease III [Frankia sp.]|nr:exodeoxyribonuclease III [Frankia sp.]
MLLATWNVNSLKMRLPRVLEFVERHKPDVLCLQETKVAADAFPHREFEDVGYRAVDYSVGRWAGVAIVARAETPPVNEVRGLPGEVQTVEARWVEADIRDVRVASVYVTNGRTLDSPSYADKLAFLDAMAARLASLRGRSLFVAGDMNIAPEDRDVWDPSLFRGTTHTSKPERDRLCRILDTGLVDAYRAVEPDGAQFTYWDYRAGMFHKNFGMRIDLALVSTDLAPRLKHCGIDRDFRKGTKPSDHAPLVVELA